MRTIKNNLIVLGIFTGIGIIALLVGVIAYFLTETQIVKIGGLFRSILYISQFFVYFGMHFVFARMFIKSSGNYLSALACFSLILLISVLFIFFVEDLNINFGGMMENPMLFLLNTIKIIHSPNIILSIYIGDRLGMPVEKIVFSISVLISIVMQFLGIILRLKK